MTWPKMTYSICSGATPARSSAPRAAACPRATAGTEARLPPSFVKGVRAAPRMTDDMRGGYRCPAYDAPGHGGRRDERAGGPRLELAALRPTRAPGARRCPLCPLVAARVGLPD